MILKLSKSGKAWVIIDDFGNVYTASRTYVNALESGRSKLPFTVLTRMPMPAAMDRFQPSPVLGKEGEHYKPNDERWTPPQCSHNIIANDGSTDALSKHSEKKRSEEKAFQDKKIDW